MRYLVGPILLIVSFVGILHAMKIFLDADFIAGGLLFWATLSLGLAGVDMTIVGVKKGTTERGQS